MDQNEVTKHFSVGNTFCQATIHATGKLISSPTTAQFLTKSNFSDTLSKMIK